MAPNGGSANLATQSQPPFFPSLGMIEIIMVVCTSVCLWIAVLLYCACCKGQETKRDEVEEVNQAGGITPNPPCSVTCDRKDGKDGDHHHHHHRVEEPLERHHRSPRRHSGKHGRDRSPHELDSPRRHHHHTGRRERRQHTRLEEDTARHQRIESADQKFRRTHKDRPSEPSAAVRLSATKIASGQKLPKVVPVRIYKKFMPGGGIHERKPPSDISPCARHDDPNYNTFADVEDPFQEESGKTSRKDNGKVGQHDIKRSQK